MFATQTFWAPFLGFFFRGPASERISVAHVIITQMHTRVNAVRIKRNIHTDVDISFPSMLNIFAEDLHIHTNLLAPLCLLYPLLHVEGMVSRDSVLLHLGRVLGSVHLGIRLEK